MLLPPNLQKKYLTRFDELIAEGESIHKAMQITPGTTRRPYLGSSKEIRSPDTYTVDMRSFVRWNTSCIELLSQVVPPNSALRTKVDRFQQMTHGKYPLEWGISTLQAVKDNFEKGFIADLPVQVETEIATDYMGQAEGLLREGQSGRYDHVPAAVLAGAVLEKALRTLCSQQNTPIPTIKPDGDAKKLTMLIDDLKKADVFNEAKAKQLRAWAAIRNHAAHGEFDQFTRNDVELMLPGINNFLADYLK